jgi:hypothetical protein
VTEPCSWVGTVADSVTAVAAVTAAVAASRGVSTWKAELKGNHEYDVARRTYLAALKVREAVAVVRVPMTPASESIEAAKEAGLAHDDLKVILGREVRYTVFTRRWKPVVEAMRELEGCGLEAEVAISEKCRPLVIKVRRHVLKLNLAIDHQLRREEADHRPPEMKEFDDAQLAIFAKLNPEGDAYEKELQDLIDELAGHLKPHLDRSGPEKKWWQLWR